MPFGFDDVGYMGAFLQGLGGIFGGGGGEKQEPVGRYSFEDIRNLLLNPQMGQFNQLTPEYNKNLQKAMAGEYGLSPDILKNMFNMSASNLRPQFRQQQTQLQSSFNPRMQGSGAMATAMRDLLGQQSQTLGGVQTGINTQDAMGRQQGQFQGLAQQGNMWSNYLNTANNAWMQWLNMSRGVQGA